MRALILGALAVAMTVNARAADVSENFDNVTAPALPSGWTATGFTTVAGGGSSEPNRAFAPDNATTSNFFLNTPTFDVAGPLQVRFKQFYATEALFDGGLFEVQYDNGAFVEVTDAGGEFLSGGYNGVLNAVGTNPLAGKHAWTGNSGGFIETVVNLPAAPHGQVRFAFHFGSDNGTANVGWSIDDFELFDGCHITCPAEVDVVSEPGVCGAVATFDKANASNCGVVLVFPPSGSFFEVGSNKVTAVSEAGAFCETHINVTDNQAPAAMCPPDIEVVAEKGVCAAPALFVTPAGSDNCTSTTTCSTNPGETLPMGSTEITCTTTDGAGRSASCTFNYIVDIPDGDKGAACDEKNKSGGCAASAGSAPLVGLLLVSWWALRRTAWRIRRSLPSRG